MLKIAICDDEKPLRKALCQTLDFELSFCGIACRITEFDSGESLLKQVDSDFDILFLDIEMGRLNGMETARLLRNRKEKMVIIFVTSHPDYVFQGYEVGALNYILKPYNEKKITEVLHQALQTLADSKERYFLVKQKVGSVKISFRDMLYFHSEGRKIIVVTKQESYTIYAKLVDLEKEIPDFFVRTHNRYLVNINYVSQMNATEVICCNKELPVSRSYQQNLAIAFSKKILR